MEIHARFPSYAIITAPNGDKSASKKAETSATELAVLFENGRYPFKKVQKIYGNGADCGVQAFVLGGISMNSIRNIAKFYGLQTLIFVTRESPNVLRYQFFDMNNAGDFVEMGDAPAIDQMSVEKAIRELDSFLDRVVLPKQGQYGKLFEGLTGGPKIPKYYWQCRCTGMAGAQYDSDGVVCG